MSTGPKALAWFSIVYGILTLALPLVLLAWGRFAPPSTIVVWLVLGVTGAISGFFGLRKRAWAFWLMFALWLVQVCEYFSESFYFSFMGPLSLRIGWGSFSPPSRFNINIIAIVLCIVALFSTGAMHGHEPESKRAA